MSFLIYLHDDIEDTLNRNNISITKVSISDTSTTLQINSPLESRTRTDLFLMLLFSFIRWYRGFQYSFVEIDHEIFSTVILSLPLIQEGQLSVSGERMCTILVNHLEDYACPVNVWLGKLTALDMTPLGWLGRKTSTQTNRGFQGTKP